MALVISARTAVFASSISAWVTLVAKPVSTFLNLVLSFNISSNFVGVIAFSSTSSNSALVAKSFVALVISARTAVFASSISAWVTLVAKPVSTFLNLVLSFNISSNFVGVIAFSSTSSNSALVANGVTAVVIADSTAVVSALRANVWVIVVIVGALFNSVSNSTFLTVS